TRSDRDWSSDVCSSDLGGEEAVFAEVGDGEGNVGEEAEAVAVGGGGVVVAAGKVGGEAGVEGGAGGEEGAGGGVAHRAEDAPVEIGRASCRERGEDRGV